MSFYIPPRFLDRLAVHITKNFLNLPNVKVPLILGIHGRKGEGKTFMCELVFKRMGIGVVYMSAGELESPDAGDPARLIRLRYREAGEWSRVHGRMAVLMINDVDAGIGRVDASTQYTVNTQLVNATLMNIADNPTNVQLPGSYDAEPTQRIPIILTGNDFSTLYAPLIRDGRMEKFFWDPSREDRIGIVNGIFGDDGVPRSDVEKLIDTFADQATDFFGAIRSRLFDEQVRALIYDVGIEKISQKVVHSDGSPVEFKKPNFALAHLIEIGRELVKEQQRIRELRLSEEYNEVLRQNVNRLPTPMAAAQPKKQSHASEYFTYYGSSSDSGNSGAEKATPTNKMPSSTNSSGTNSSGVSSSGVDSPGVDKSGIDPAILSEIRSMTDRNLKLGIEYVDERRFRTGSWQCFGTFQTETEAIAALDSCLTDNPNAYIRIVGIDKHRTRIAETIVHRPPKEIQRFALYSVPLVK